MQQCLDDILTLEGKPQSTRLKKLRALLKKEGSQAETNSQVLSCLEELLFVRDTLPASVSSAAYVLKEFSPPSKISELVAAGLAHWDSQLPVTENQAAVLEAVIHAAPPASLDALTATLWERTLLSLAHYVANLEQNMDAYVQNVIVGLTLFSSEMAPDAAIAPQLRDVIQASLVRDRQTTAHVLNSAFLWVRLGGAESPQQIPSRMSVCSRLAVIRGLIIQGDPAFTLQVLPVLLEQSADNSSITNNQRFFLYRALGAAVDSLWRGFKKAGSPPLDPAVVDSHLYPLLLVTSEESSSGVVPKRDKQVDQLLQIIGATAAQRSCLARFAGAMCEPHLVPGPLSHLVRRFGMAPLAHPELVLQRALRCIDNQNAGKIRSLIDALIERGLPWAQSYLKVFRDSPSVEEIQRITTYALPPLVQVKGALLTLTKQLLDLGIVLPGLLALKCCRMNSLIDADAMRQLVGLGAYVTHLEPPIRLAAGWCVASVRKQKSSATPWECQVMRTFVTANLAHGFRHNFRHACVEIMMRFWRRSGIEAELAWAEETLLDSLYPGCPSSKQNTAVDLYAQLPSRAVTRYAVVSLFQLLLSRQDRVREVAAAILDAMPHSESLPGLSGGTLQTTFEMLQSVHARDCDSAALQFRVLLPHVAGVHLAVFPETRVQLSDAPMSTDDVVTQLIRCVAECAQRAESDFEYVARERPMHGMLKLIRTLLPQCTPAAVLQRAVDLLPQVTTLSLTVIGMEAAERDLGDSYEKVAAWRINKEVSLIIPVLCRWEFSLEQSALLGVMLFRTLYESKHRGVLENAYYALERLCVSLLKCSGSPEKRALPEEWLRGLLAEVRGAEHRKTNYIITRRSAGLPFGVVAILRAERMTSGLRDASPLLDTAVPQLLQIAEEQRTDGESLAFDQQRGYSNLVHALNVLRMVVMDGCINEVTQQYVEAATLLALGGYHSDSWAVRNSSSLLFAACSRRFKDTISYSLFETRHAALLAAVLEDLREPESPTVFPILLLLQHVQRLKSDSAELLRTLRSVLSHPHFLVRRKAAQVLARLMPDEAASHWQLSISGSTANGTHGRLLCALELCRLGLLRVQAVPLRLLHSARCPAIASVALDVAHECGLAASAREAALRVRHLNAPECRQMPMFHEAQQSAARILGDTEPPQQPAVVPQSDAELAVNLQDDEEDVRRAACELVGAGEESQCLARVFGRLPRDTLFAGLTQLCEMHPEEADEKRVFEQETVNEFCDPVGACRLAYETLESSGTILEGETKLRLQCLEALAKVRQCARWDEMFAPVIGAIFVIRLITAQQFPLDQREQELMQQIDLEAIEGIPPLLVKEWNKV